MTTFDLFEGLCSESIASSASAPYVRGSETSREAAESVENALAYLERVVFDAVKAAGLGGLICDEIEVVTGLAHQTASARVRGLEQRGYLRRTEDRRKTRSGRQANVYVAVERVA